ncbi:O-antigen polysaccharide polymerase Wzy [Marinobacter mangrovi]|uniref:O-antigen polysaccharide polymerase Wzy n=1 Tax=Marinobacter mangrovi TaxID=2803918 RepID=UPI001931D2D8|nr:O-antigen polysaccharide polymerase Wzy [Marinobacter mangrovi]
MQIPKLSKYQAFLMLLLLLGLQSLALISVVLPLSTSQDSWFLIAFVTSLTMVGAGTVLAWRQRDYFDAMVLVYLAFVAFHGGQIFLVATIGLPKNEVFLDGYFNFRDCLWLVLLVGYSSIALAFGMVLASSSSPKMELPVERLSRYESNLKGMGVFLLFLSSAFFIKESYIYAQNLAEGGRYGVFGGGDRVGVEATGKILFHAFPVSGLLLIAGAGRSKFFLVTGILVCAINFYFHLYLGNRGYAFMPVLASVWLIDRIHWRFSRMWLAPLGASVLFVVFPVIRVLRSSPDGKGFLQLLTQVDFLSLARESLFELGSQLRVVGWVPDLISIHGFQFGETYIRAISTVIPNLFWKVHWGVQGVMLRDDIKDYVRADVLGWDKQMGWGGSILGEAVLNFGVICSVFMMVFIGYALSRFHRWSLNSNNPAKMFVFAVLVANIFMSIRGEMHQLVRPVIWFGVLPYLAIIVLPAIRFRHSSIK